MPKLTKRFVESITPDTSKLLKFWDSELKGFGLFVLPSGRRTYYFQYRNAAREKKCHKIGVHGQVTTDEARAQALLRAAALVKGEDPAFTRKQDLKPTMSDLVEEYLAKYLCHKRVKSKREDTDMIRKFLLPELGKKEVRQLAQGKFKPCI